MYPETFKVKMKLNLILPDLDNPKSLCHAPLKSFFLNYFGQTDFYFLSSNFF